MISFHPRHKGKAISDETKTNAEFLVRQMCKPGPSMSLEQCLRSCSFREENPSTADTFKFAFRVDEEEDWMEITADREVE